MSVHAKESNIIVLAGKPDLPALRTSLKVDESESVSTNELL